MRQLDVAVRAGLSRTTVGRIELGELDGIPLGMLERVVRALGASLEIGVRWNGEGLDRLLDEAHASLVETVVGMLGPLRWEVAVEVSFALAGERGSVDILAFHATTGIVLVVEVKSVVPDLQAMLHGLDRKARLGRAIAQQRGWPATSVARWLVLRDTRTNRRRLDEHRATVDAVLADSGRAVIEWLRAPTVPPMAGRSFVAADGPPIRGGRQRVRVGTSDMSRRTGAGPNPARFRPQTRAGP